MFSEYLLTGATGFLGNTIAWKLHEKGLKCRALVMEGDRFKSKLPPSIEQYDGDILDLSTLGRFFEQTGKDACLLHCAGIVSIASKQNPMIYKVNVEGTRNIIRLAASHNIGKVIHVSSIHAIPEKPKGQVMTEVDTFDEMLVKGEYAKSKAAASQIASRAAYEGMNISIVHPAGIIGPGDWRHGQITSTIISYCKGKLPAGVHGGNNFVDVRDVADGILACAENGRAGECYILSGHNTTVKNILEHVRKIINGKRLFYLPLQIVKMIAPVYERVASIRHEVPFLTPYSAYALGVNADYSHEKATREFGYTPRKIHETIEDTVKWLIAAKQISGTALNII